MIPAKPPSMLQSTKLPILIQRTLTPLSRAPIRLPPVATVWTPHLVRTSTIWRTTTASSAHQNSELNHNG